MKLKDFTNLKKEEQLRIIGYDCRKCYLGVFGKKFYRKLIEYEKKVTEKNILDVFTSTKINIGKYLKNYDILNYTDRKMKYYVRNFMNMIRAINQAFAINLYMLKNYNDEIISKELNDEFIEKLDDAIDIKKFLGADLKFANRMKKWVPVFNLGLKILIKLGFIKESSV